jgi:hypothetical protein
MLKLMGFREARINTLGALMKKPSGAHGSFFAGFLLASRTLLEGLS